MSAPDADQPPKVYRDLIDPDDPLATAAELAAGAIEVLDELRSKRLNGWAAIPTTI